ncbi:MAG: hypothetical protein QOH25_1228 [Acidobacteriota bacterium]|jgi:hypothetical protein|nr:hypothetical protein [Acidobacteriota bacterium]
MDEDLPLVQLCGTVLGVKKGYGTPLLSHTSGPTEASGQYTLF